MPASRKRRPRKTSSSRQRSRNIPETSVLTLRPGQSMEPYLTEDDVAHMKASIEAAARGDAHGAWRHLMAGLVVEETIQGVQLTQLMMLGKTATPGWMYSRWAADQAYRWMLVERDPRIDRAVIETIAAAHWEQVEGLRPLALTEYGTRVAAGDWVTRQLALFEHAGLADFLEVQAQAPLRARCDHVRDWADAAMGGFVLEGAGASGVQARNLATRDLIEVLDLGALIDREPGTAVLGRIVPVDVGPGLMFESPPQTVDLRTAREAARLVAGGDRLGWLEAIDRGRTDGRLAPGFSCGSPALWSDDFPFVRSSLLDHAGGERA